MPNNCYSLVRGRAMRVTRLDGCGNVVPGDDSSIVSDGFVTVGFTAQTDEGTTISVTNAAGKICILDEPCPTFTGYDISIEFCAVNPALYSLITCQDTVVDGDDNAVGFRVNSKKDACDCGFALEVWSSVPAGTCDTTGGQQYGYFLVPFVKGGTLGDFTIGNDAVSFTINGAASKDGSQWGIGPYDVVNDGTGPSPLLEPIEDGDHLHLQLTTVAPPEPDCDPVPVGNLATGASAGIPGTATPANSYFPDTLAEMTGITASPTTAWTSGQYIELGDGTWAHWDGTAWVAGAAT